MHPARKNRFRITTVILALTALSACASTRRPLAGTQPANATGATAAYMEAVRDDPNALLLFIRQMPKGGDIHSHLSGAVYAESYIRWAEEDGSCLVRATLSLSPPPCEDADGEIPAAEIARNPALYGDVIDAWSMRNWNPSQKTGHARFFGAFSKFGAQEHRIGDMLAEVTVRAASQNITYLELMFGPDRGRAIRLGIRAGADDDFGRMRNKLIDAGLRDSLGIARRRVDDSERSQRTLMGCDSVPELPACRVVVRYLYQVSRGLPPEAVFAQILAGFEMATADPRFVGFNLVMPEDYPIPMRDFSLHMRMIDFLHAFYPDVKITLHAGELSEGLVPPEGLTFHIRESIGPGRASRIGHGTAIMHEDNSPGLLREMAARKILVEVSLASSDGILGIRGRRHPLTTYLAHGVPVALATDDEGVSRTSLTHEFRKAVEEQGLDYMTIKAMARNSIAYAFVEDGTKARLLAELDDAFTRFEAYHAGLQKN
ncbi:MAG: adenosine deaminase family protein [Gemmatimonadaceae bacterium]